MLMNVRDIKKQKGQGIVEYALLLAFILAIAIAMQGSGIDTAIANTFTRVAQALGFETDQDKWSTMNANDLLNDSASAAARLASDQEFLSNIGNHFIGMDKATLASILKVNVSKLDKIDSNGILLGHFTEDTDADGNFIKTNFDNQISASGNDLFNWATKSPDGTAFDSSRRYLFSDYALSNSQEHYNNGNKKTGNGIKIMNVGFDSDGKVTSVNLAVNPNSGVEIQGKTSRADLNVTVNK